MVAAIGEIIQELIKAQEENKNVNLNSLKTKIAGKYALKTTPRLVDIIAAIPREYHKSLKPKLLAKPIRTASGVNNHCYEKPQVDVHYYDILGILILYFVFVDRSSCCNV